MLSDREANDDVAPVAYFYCARNGAEPLRAEPDAAVRALLKQLGCLGGTKQISESLQTIFLKQQNEADEDGCDPALLGIDECVSLILDCLKDNPATIVIDALDECRADRRHELLNALDNIISQAENVVKILISSRDDIDIVLRLTNSPNVSISANDNAKDITTYTNTEVTRAIEERRLLHGNVSNDLRDEIIKALVDGARGMFRWVALSIQHLCDNRRMILEDDVKEAMGRLPKSLSGLYRIVYEEEILLSEPQGRAVAIRALKWLLCAVEPLKTEHFLEAVSQDFLGQATVVSQNAMIALLRNLVVIDEESDVFRFAHLSVREYLESRDEYSAARCHAMAASISANIALVVENVKQAKIKKQYAEPSFFRYSFVFWPIHYQQAKLDDVLQMKMKSLLLQDRAASDGLIHWTRELKHVLENDDVWLSRLLPYDSEKVLLDLLACTPAPLFHFCCMFGQVAILETLQSSGFSDWSVIGSAGWAGLDIAISCDQRETACFLLQQPGIKAGFRPKEEGSPLLESIRLGQLEVVKLLLKNGDVNVNIQTPSSSESPLGVAAQCGHLEITSLLLARADLNINERDAHSRTALHRAATAGHESVVKLLLQRDDIDLEPGIFLKSTLLEAAKNGHFAAMLLLLEKIPPPSIRSSKGGETLLHLAVSADHIRTVDTLLHRIGININTIDYGGNTPFLIAIKCGTVKIARLLFECAGIDVSLANKNGRTPLHEIMLPERSEQSRSSAQWYDFGRSLIKHPKSQINHQDFFGRTPLHCAVVSNHAVLVQQLLLRKEIQPNLQNDYGSTPLWEAAYHGRLEITQTLLDIPRVDVKAKDKRGRTPLFMASTYGYLEIVRLLLNQSDIEINLLDRDEEGETCLFAATKSASIGVLRLILDRGWDVNDTNNLGQTPLHRAIERGQQDMVELLLLQDRINTNARDGLGRSPLWIASYLGNKGVVETLAQSNGIDLNAQDLEGNTPLNIAAFWGNVEVFEYLLQQDGIKISLANCRGETLLWTLASKGYSAILEIYFKQGYLQDLNTQDNLGQTPLYAAVLHQKMNTMKLLLKQPGLDLKLKSHQHVSPLGRAARMLALGTAGGHPIQMVYKELLMHCVRITANEFFLDFDKFVESGFVEEIGKFLEIYKTPEDNTAEKSGPQPSGFLQVWLDLTEINVRARDDRGITALHTAAVNGLTQVVIVLLRCEGVDVAATTTGGETPLFLAAQAGHTDVVEVLVAEKKLRSTDGKVLDAAAEAGHEATVRVLERCFEPQDRSPDTVVELGLFVGGDFLPSQNINTGAEKHHRRSKSTHGNSKQSQSDDQPSFSVKRHVPGLVLTEP